MREICGYPIHVVELIIEALKRSKDGVGIFNDQEVLLFANEALANPFGFKICEAEGQSFPDILRISYANGVGVKVDDGDIERVIKNSMNSAQSVRGGGFTSFETDSIDEQWGLVSVVGMENGHTFRYRSDITPLKKVEEELRAALATVEKLAREDVLTGIRNRRAFIEDADSEIARALRYKHPLSVLALDIDHFKQVNDTYGHQAGDDVLKRIASCTNGLLRANDVFGRLGGEEFCVVLPETDKQGALLTAERIRKEIEVQIITTDSHEIQVTTSIGISELNQASQDLTTLLKVADEALYQAKEGGRNQVCVGGGN